MKGTDWCEENKKIGGKKYAQRFWNKKTAEKNWYDTSRTNESFHNVKHHRSSTFSRAESGPYKKVIALNVAECVLG